MKKMLVSFAALAAFGAQASAVSYSLDLYKRSPGTTVQFTLPAFDTSLGTLTSVRYRLDTDTFASIDVDNHSSTDATFTNLRASVLVNLSGPSGTLSTLTVSTRGVSGTASSSGPNVFYGLEGSNGSSGFVRFNNFAFYESDSGASLLDFSLNLDDAAYSASSLAGLSFSGRTSVSFTTSIVYGYDAVPTTVPEPTTLALAGLALAGLIAARRNRPAGPQ